MSSCLIGLGSNVGDRQATLELALEALARCPKIGAIRASRFVESPAVGGPVGQGPYVNAAAVFQTSLDPQAVLAAIQGIETQLGRMRTVRWGPRTLDLDILLYDSVVLCTSTLVLPHPRMACRRFVLEPAAEVAGSMIHPTTGWTVARLLAHLNEARDYVAIAGPIAAGQTELARRLAQNAEGHWIAGTAAFSRADSICADSLGQEGQAALQWVEEQARLLAPDGPLWAKSASFWVSDFWLDECLAYAEVFLPPSNLPAIRERMAVAAANAVQPKLIVHLDGDASLTAEPSRVMGWPPAVNDEVLDRLRQSLRACLDRPNVGPVLTLGDGPAEENLREVLAAVEGMK